MSLLYAGFTGKLTGRVIDATTAIPLPGCNIVAENTVLGAGTDMNGYFTIFNIPPGTYSIRAEMIGYGEMIYTDVVVNIDLTTTLEFALTIEVLQGESVTVKAEKSMINKGLTASTAIVSSDELSKLPVTELSDVLNLQAGFISGHLRGGREGEVAYWIDGVPVTDGYDGGTVVDVNKDMVAEMQLVSGAFNAEYGQAMSGIVNIVTKEGSDNFGGNMNMYFGDFMSSKNDIYWNIDKVNPFTTKNIDLSLRGSLIPKKLYYYFNSRFIYYQGVFEGKEKFLPHSYGDEIVHSDGTPGWYILGTDEITDSLINLYVLGSRLEDITDSVYVDSMYHSLRNAHANTVGSGKYIPMEWNIKKYIQGKLIYRLSPFTKLKYSIISDDVEYQDYDRMYRLNPQGNLHRKRLGLTHIINLNHALNKTTFFNLGLSRFSKEYSHRTFEDMKDYIHETLAVPPDGYSFLPGGSNNNLFSRNTSTSLYKVDLTSQVNLSNHIKIGVEYRQHQLDYEDINLQPPDSLITIDHIYESPFLLDPQILPDSSIHTSRYHFEPQEFSVYIQDKIELSDLIINAGIRFDYFDPRGRVLSDPSDPSIYNPIKPENRFYDLNNDGIQDANEMNITVQEREAYWYQKTTAKTAISPRLGVSFPFSDKGVVHFSYGHFFQIPRFELLYSNSDFDLGQGTGNVGIIGNADLKPESTVSYELGIQQILSSNISMDATMYMRDIRNLTGTRSDEIIIFGGASSYNKYENSDFAFIRGLVLSFNSRSINGFSGSLDYTFQIARGTASDPDQAQNAISIGALPEIHLIALDWDQTHTLNATFNYSKGNTGISFIGQTGSGLSYTPESIEDISTLIQNSAKKPITWNIDMRAYYKQRIFSQNIDFYCRIQNLFDHLNQTDIYSDTGVADRTRYISLAQSQNPNDYYNTVEDWYNNETYYSKPRYIEIGMSYAF